MAIYASFKGQKQGEIKGGVTTKGWEGKVQIDTCDFGLTAPYDTATGLASGRRVAKPVHLTKPLDKSSPLLYMACTTNETLQVEINYMEEGANHKALVIVKLTNAMLREFSHTANGHAIASEKLALTYTKFEFTWCDGGIMATDDWMNPT